MLIPIRIFVPENYKEPLLRAYLPATSKHPLEDILVLLSLSFVYDIRADTVNYSLLIKRQKPGRTRRPLRSGERMPHRELHLFLWQLYVIEFLRGRSINLCMRLTVHQSCRIYAPPYFQRANLQSFPTSIPAWSAYLCPLPSGAGSRTSNTNKVLSYSCAG